jgi:hypothetical protein
VTGPVSPNPSPLSWPAHAAFALTLGLALGAGTLWSSWPLLAAGVCVMSAWGWRVTRL